MEKREIICRNAIKDKKKVVPYFIGLWLTDGCNLKCRYCFQDRYKPTVTMTQGVLDQTIKYINESKPSGLSFFGGEPLLAQKGIKQVLAKTNVKEYFLTTNGTLFNDDIFDWLEFHKVHINLSLDGAKDTQDYWRDNSYDRIIEHLPRILRYFKEIGGNVLTTCVMESKLYENVKHIKDLGFPHVYINQLDSYSSKVRNEVEKIDLFCEQYKKVLTLDSPTFEVSDFYRWEMVLSGNKKAGHCGYGNRGLGISPTGFFSACHRAPELPDEFRFGNVFDGIDKEKEARVRGAPVLPSKCAACDIHFNQCPVSCYHQFNRFGMEPHDVHCAYEKAKVEIIRAHTSWKDKKLGLEKAVLQKKSNVRLIVGTMIDPHKYYVLPIFLKNLVKMKFPPITDYYFILNEDDHTTYKLLAGWKEGNLGEAAPYCNDIVRSFKTIRIPVHASDGGLDRITRGRELMLGMTLKGNYTHLFFLDSDIITPPSTVQDLIAVDSPMAGALVTTRDEGRRNIWYNTYIDKRATREGFPSKTDFVKGDIIDVDATGCDCVLITRETLQAVGCYEWESDPSLAEDMWFCLKAKEKGFGLKIHTGVVTRHLGVKDMALQEIKGQDTITER